MKTSSNVMSMKLRRKVINAVKMLVISDSTPQSTIDKLMRLVENEAQSLGRDKILLKIQYCIFQAEYAQKQGRAL